MPLRLRVTIAGGNEVLRAFRELDPMADQVLRDRTLDVSKELADRIRAAGMADTRQSARAARSVKAVRDRTPKIKAGGTKGSRPFLFGSEFGMTRKSGWYAKARYFESSGAQFRPHVGQGSYWFFRTAEANQPWMEREWLAIADELVRRWSA